MTLRPLIPFLLLAMHSALPAQDADTPMRKGNDALAAGLWEMAALHFNECLGNPSLDPAEKSQAAIRLAEALIREGKPQDATRILDESFATSHPEAPFWKAQALAASGRFTDAVAALTPLTHDPDSPHWNQSVLTTASLQLALGNPEDALNTLSALANAKKSALASRARLYQVEILMELGRFTEARESMPPLDSIPSADSSLAIFLEAALLLNEDRLDQAAAYFQSLVDQPQGQSLRHHHAAVIGLFDTLRKMESMDAAASLLLNFIQSHPDSPLLEAMFKRLQEIIPATPTPTDPILERIAQWIPPAEIPATSALAAYDSSAASAWPTVSASNDLIAFSLFTRAIGLHRIGTPESTAEARHLLTRLRLENPGHFLANRALLLTARWAIQTNATSRAFVILDALKESATSPLIKGKAAFLQARTAALRDDKSLAITLFDEAAAALSHEDARIAALNAAILRLTRNPGGSTPVLQTDTPPDPVLTKELELERALSETAPSTRRSAIEEFLIRHPDHPRAPEARLVAAEAALDTPEPDLSFARAQLETIAADPEKSASLSQARIALVKLRIEDLSQDTTAAIATARSIIEQFPADPTAPEASLILGRLLFQTRSYNDARLVLENLAASDTEPARAQTAWLLAARSAALVPTAQSQQEALILFDKAIAAQGPVASMAMLEKARLMIDMNRLTEATSFLRAWFDSLPETDPLHLPAGLMLAEAIYAQGSINPDSLTDALAIYDQLLVHADKFPSFFNRLQYLRGRTLEQIPDETNPAIKRDKQAFIAYYSVLETTTPPLEWHYFELCGFRALALLEKANRWPAAVACAKKIASFNGPRAQEAATRASQLQLKYHIWED